MKAVVCKNSQWWYFADYVYLKKMFRKCIINEKFDVSIGQQLFQYWNYVQKKNLCLVCFCVILLNDIFILTMYECEKCSGYMLFKLPFLAFACCITVKPPEWWLQYWDRAKLTLLRNSKCRPFFECVTINQIEWIMYKNLISFVLVPPSPQPGQPTPITVAPETGKILLSHPKQGRYMYQCCTDESQTSICVMRLCK